MNSTNTLTHTAMQLFKNCRRAYRLRYIDEFVPIEVDSALHFGSMIHKCLEMWYTDGLSDAVFDFINDAYKNNTADNANESRLKCIELMRAYFLKYPNEDFEILHIEKSFANNNGAAIFAGKVDGLVRDGDGDNYILEHKTAAATDANYFDKLWMDSQVISYLLNLEISTGLPIKGVIYNVLKKTLLKQRRAESDEEFATRRAALLARSKTGKTTAKQKVAESDEEFSARLSAKFQGGEMFERIKFLIKDSEKQAAARDLEMMQDEILSAIVSDRFYRNTNFCTQFGKCRYFRICQSNDNPAVIAADYVKLKPHGELKNE